MIRAVALGPSLPGIAHPCARTPCPEPAAWHIVRKTRGQRADGTVSWRATAVDVCERHRRELAAPVFPRVGA